MVSGCREWIRTALQTAWGEIVSYEETLPSESDFRSVLSRVIASKPEIIYAPITSHLIPFFRQLRQLGFEGPVITSDNITEELIAQGDGVFEGVFQTMVADPQNAEANRLKSLYRKSLQGNLRCSPSMGGGTTEFD